MKVSINNKEVETDAVTLLQLTTELSLPAQGVAVAANNRMIPRTEWADYALSEGISICFRLRDEAGIMEKYNTYNALYKQVKGIE